MEGHFWGTKSSSENSVSTSVARYPRRPVIRITVIKSGIACFLTTFAPVLIPLSRNGVSILFLVCSIPPDFESNKNLRATWNVMVRKNA